jgi:hypothetical protein
MSRSVDTIRSRVAAWQATGNPAALWPDIKPEARQQAHKQITAVTSTVLSGSVVPPALTSDHEVTPAAVGVAAYVSGLGALLGHWIEHATVQADDPVRKILHSHLDHGRRRWNKLTPIASGVAAKLQDAGVTPTIFKGAHTAHHYFPDPGTRPASDIDILVHPAQFAAARVALSQQGLIERRRPAGPERSEWLPAGPPQPLRSLDLDHADNPWSLDLHHSLERAYFRGRTAGFGERAHTDSAAWTLDGQSVRILAQPLLTAYLALNASSNIHDLRLLHLVELALVIRRDAANGLLSWEPLCKLLRETQTARFVYPAIELTERLVPGTVDGSVRQLIAKERTERMRRVVDGIWASGIRGFRQRSLTEKLMWAAGPTELLLNIGELIWPTAGLPSESSRWTTFARRFRMLLGGQASIRDRPTDPSR